MEVRFGKPLQGLVDGDANLEARVAGDGGEGNRAAKLADNTMHGIEAETRAVADALGGEEGLEDARLNVFWDTGTIVGDFDDDFIALADDAEAERAFIVHSVGSVVDEIGPDLIEFAAVGGDLGNVGSEIADHGDALAELVLHDGDGGFQAADDVDFLHRRLVHIG